MTAESSFAARLAAATSARGQLCVGVDPHPGLLEVWGLPDDVDGLERFSRDLVEALADSVACFKPQAAFFEAFGPAGLAVLQRVLADIKAAGAISLLDCKRGDIDSTMAAYARAYLQGGAPLQADAITVSPFLGFASLEPAIDLAASNGAGLFVLTRTSNPEGASPQLARQTDGATVAQSIVDQAKASNLAAGTPLIGLVVGATLKQLDIDLGGFDGWVLAPGIGAQGGAMAGLEDLFGGYQRVLPTVSRWVADAGPSPDGLRQAVVSLLEREDT